MSPLQRIRRYITSRFNNFRHALACFEALPQLTVLGLLAGLLTGAIIVVFRFLIDGPLAQLIDGHPDNFEALSTGDRILFVFAGIFVLAVLLQIAGKKNSGTSVAHVLERIHNQQGTTPLSNWLVQFARTTIALASGQSVGSEGPAVHLGTGAASQLGQGIDTLNAIHNYYQPKEFNNALG